MLNNDTAKTNDRTIRKKIKIVLKSKVRGLGSRGDVCYVKPGYFRNLLNIKGYAVKYSDAAYMELHKQKEVNQEKKQKQLDISKSLENLTLIFMRQCGPTGILYSSVTNSDIKQELKKTHNVDIALNHIHIQAPQIKNLGCYKVELDLGYDITVTMEMIVASSVDDVNAFQNAMKVDPNAALNTENKNG